MFRRRSPIWRPTRRSFLSALGGSAAALTGLSPGLARAAGTADNILFFYFPDGVAGWSQAGDASLWHCTGGETDFTLGQTLQALSPFRDRCLFFNGLSMGGTDDGSHPGGAKKLLTATDHGGNESIDQHLSRSIGTDRPWHHLYLGAQAGADGASGDKFITYPVAGSTMAPEDDPRRAFSALFGSGTVSSGGSGDSTDDTPGEDPTVSRKLSVLDAVMDDIHTLQGQLGTTEKQKLDLHLQSLRELEGRLDPGGGSGGGSGGGGSTDWGGCDEPSVDIGSLTDANLNDPSAFPDILDAQIDVAVQAMACGMSRVVTLQCSHHTSELVMSRFPGTEMYDPAYDMRSHQASRYGSSHDWESLIRAFEQQRRYWVDRFAHLLGRMDSIPGRTGTLLDDSIVVLCTEVCDGNTHSHQDLPVVVAGGGGGALRTGRLLNTGGARHGDLWVALARAMGEDLWHFGDASSGPLSGVLS